MRKKEQKYMEVDVPENIMRDIADGIIGKGISACIHGAGKKAKTLLIGFYYTKDKRAAMMEILELIDGSSEEKMEV